MVKAEKVNHHIAIKRVNDNLTLLKSKPQTLSSVYDVIFSHPNYTFLNVVNNYGYDEVSYEKADKKNRLYANYFSSTIDEKEKYVGLLLENSEVWIYSFFGLLLSGFVPVLLSTENGDSELEYVIAKLGIKTIITRKELNQKVNVIVPDDIKEVEGKKKQFANGIVFLSSGSTGMPKIVFYNGEEICNQLYQADSLFKKHKGIDSVYKGYFKHLVVLPFYHIFGLITVLLWFSFFNVTFVLPLSVNPKHLRQAALLTHPTHIFAVPLLFETIYHTINNKCDTDKKKKKLKKAFKTSLFLQKHFGSLGLSIVRNVMFKKYLNLIFTNSIRFCICGGAFIEQDALKAINLIGYPLINGYGSTEIGITSLCPGNNIEERFSTSIGEPFDAVSYKIENDYLYVKSLSASSHLISSEGKEEKLSHEDWINTFDKAKEENGKYYLLGRDDEIVVLANGENISLSLKEKELVLPLSKEYALIEVEHKIILIASYDKLASLNNVKEELEKVRDSQHIISQFYYTNASLPKANTIKYKRYKLVELFKEYPSLFVPLARLENNEEELENEHQEELLSTMIGLFSSLFPNAKVNANSHFYNDLNGDSLTYFILLNKIEETFNVEINYEKETPLYTPIEFAKRLGDQN